MPKNLRWGLYHDLKSEMCSAVKHNACWEMEVEVLKCSVEFLCLVIAGFEMGTNWGASVKSSQSTPVSYSGL